MRTGLLTLTVGFVLATAAIVPSAKAADASFYFLNQTDYTVSISLDNESRCTLPANGNCTINFDGSTSHTFYYALSDGRHSTTTYNPGMALNEDCEVTNTKSADCMDDDIPF